MEQPRDSRLKQVEQVIIPWETFKKAFRRNYLEPKTAMHSNRSYVLRLYPPFEAKMVAEHHEREQGTHYPPDMDPKPIHISPRVIIETGRERGLRGLIEWPTDSNTKHALHEKTIEEIGGIEKAVEESREIFWDEAKHYITKIDEFDLGSAAGYYQTVKVSVEWMEGVDNDRVK